MSASLCTLLLATRKSLNMRGLNCYAIVAILATLIILILCANKCEEKQKQETLDIKHAT